MSLITPEWLHIDYCAPCPMCGKIHNSNDQNADWAFVCSPGCYLIQWHSYKDRPPELVAIFPPDDDIGTDY